MHILMAAAEMAPFCKTGGLADVLGALPCHLAQLTADIRIGVVLPGYSQHRHLPRPRRPGWRPVVPMGPRLEQVEVTTAAVTDRVDVHLVQHPCFRGRGGLYGDAAGAFPDNDWRFALFAKVVAALARRRRPDIVHGHDWHTGLVPFLLRHDQDAPTVFTVHNLGYQGNVHARLLDDLGPDAHAFFHVDALEYYGQVSFLKAGLVFADALTTVSPTYAQEILTPAVGLGMDGVLRGRSEVLSGILNGIDDDIWNPAADPFLPAAYDPTDLTGKARCKQVLQECCGLPVKAAAPLAGTVTRLVAEKGIDLLCRTTAEALDDGVNLQLIVLGSGAPECEAQVRQLAARFPDNVAAELAFSDELAHLIEGGADLFLMPSRYEACGLNQMYSLRYGTVPVVHATGGLRDTVIDPRRSEATANGFAFDTYTEAAFGACLRRALAAYARPAFWRRLQVRGMAVDLSWTRAAQQYLDIYRDLMPVTTGEEEER